MRKRLIRLTAACLALCMLSGCAEESSVTLGEDGQIETVRQAETVTAFQFSASGIVHAAQRFLPEYSQLAMTAPEGAVIRYTLDGSVPDADSAAYTEPIVLEQVVSDFPNCTVLRAKAYFADGTESRTATQTFWTSIDINARFLNNIISVAGDPKEITEGPDGIFYGKNVKQRGRASERAVSVEMVDKKGALLFAQDAGMRVFGAASREASLKSMKLFARKEYDPDHGKFDYDFGTAAADGETVSSYDKLVLRNGGNDFQFAFIRDELNQVLAKGSGAVDCEAVQPIVVYLNGSYYGLYWLHETICDDLLKDKYGGKGQGDYMVLEGREREKSVPEDDPEEARAAEEFNETYTALSGLDLTDNAIYAQVCDFLDVENYINYYALNIYLNNRDWPQNNQKCYRFVPAEGQSAGEGRLDGRWRFWFHDMDYAEGLYEQDETQARYNNLAEIMKPDSERYSPLFTALMQREDCKNAFVAEVTRLAEGVCTADHIKETVDSMNTERFIEMRRYFDYLEKLKETDSSIWIWYKGYNDQTNIVKYFAEKRPDYMKKYLAAAFGEPAVTESAAPAETTAPAAETTAVSDMTTTLPAEQTTQAE